MAIDTVKLRSPVIDEGTAWMLEQKCILRQGVQLETGHVLYEITTGELEGSFDSRIMFRVMRDDWVVGPDGRVCQMPCLPFVIVECSWHKFFYGQNVHGGPVDFPVVAGLFVNLLGEIMANDHEIFHDAAKWEVRCVDWAEMFHISPEGQREFFRSFRDVHYPRRARMEAKYATAIHYPGKSTTFRAYSKGPEFLRHGAAVLRRALYAVHMARSRKAANPSKGVFLSARDERAINRKVKAVQKLADWRLRVEVQINAKKLQYDFKGNFPKVSEITDGYLISVYEEQVYRLFREGRSQMETIRTYDRVKARLNSCYGKQSANSLLAFWLQYSMRGEEAIKQEYALRTFYYNRKRLVDAGVSWNQTDVFIVPQDTALPRDFVPLPSDVRRCSGRVSANSVFKFCPVEQYRLLNAA
ncbi:MAG: phage/plasmid replication protein, II/X family [Azoarcus sp.]|jgi:II/X family phage/plasmid replication protein|nr:phage/plasmid replication protein, II/X family [Azoarcus sp.]